MTHAVAIQRLKQNSGGQFDGDLLRVFLEMLEGQ
jgi:HD-GYP domain-containing protein (c-di-GMP phosphodiesterase class II)